MATNSTTPVEWITGLVTSAQSGIEVGNSTSGFNGYVNLVNLAGTLAGTTPLGVGLNAAATGTNTASAINNWMPGELTPADVMQVIGTALGAVLSMNRMEY